MDAKVARKFLGEDRSKDAYCVDIVGDGSCFFRSVLYAMDLGGFRSAKAKERTRMSRRLREIMREEVSCDDKSLREYDDLWKCGKTARKCPWAEQKMIEHCRDVLGCNMVFLDDSQEYSVFCDIDMDFKLKTIVVVWRNSRHFEPVVVMSGDGKIQGMFDPAEDHEVVARIQGCAATACPGAARSAGQRA